MRFAIAMIVADVLVWWLFPNGTAVVMGSFAVICLLYFLDYEGTTRDRLVGYASAALIGLVAIALGSLLAGPLVLAVAGAFAVSFTFAYARVLRGYVARASVGLQGAFFLPLMADVTPGEMPALLISWSIGSAVAITAGLVILPKQRPGILVARLAQWLAEARTITLSCASDEPAAQAGVRLSLESLDDITDRLAQADAELTPGIVGRRERALDYMVNGTQWGAPAFDPLTTSAGMSTDLAPQTRSLLEASAQAFADAEATLGQTRPPRDVIDLAAVRQSDLEGLGALTPEQLERHYPARLVSILATRMLWLAGRNRGRRYPTPDVGSTADRSPLALLSLNAGVSSVWFTNALRTGGVTAACVLIVRELGLQHGLWVVLAALSVTQVSFSASTNGTSAARVALGSVTGVALASLGVVLDLPHLAFVILLPALAFLASLASHVGPFWAQTAYTPFALTNLAALEWATDRNLELTRVENIALGVAVAAVFGLAVFPFGLAHQLRHQSAAAEHASRAYLALGVSAAQGAPDRDEGTSRAACVRALTLLESTLHAEAIRSTLALSELQQARTIDSKGRDRLLGGDACVDLGRQRSALPETARAADAFAHWWIESPLLNAVGVEGEGGAY